MSSAPGALPAVKRLSTLARRSSSTSITTLWKMSAESIWFSMSSAATIAKRSAGVIRGGGTLVTIGGPTEARPAGGRTVDFVVVPDRAQLSEIVRRARDGRVRTNIGNVAALDDAVAAFNPTERIKGKTIIRVRS
jgi:NADPH:quinone reductase-like Zn-dependent oxidoreductase